MPLRLCFPRHRCSYALSTWSETRLLLCLGSNVSKFVLTSRRFIQRQRNRRRSLTLNSLLRNGTSNIHQLASLGAVIGRTLSPSLLSHLRFVERFIPPRHLSQWIAVWEKWLSPNRFSPLMTLLSSWFIWRCGIFLRNGRGSIRDWKPALNRFAILFEDRLLL